MKINSRIKKHYNYFKGMIAECWIPASEIPRIKDVLDKETVSLFILLLVSTLQN
jgi:vacuolar-type H+-ATPase subunit I/STV1